MKYDHQLWKGGAKHQGVLAGCWPERERSMCCIMCCIVCCIVCFCSHLDCDRSFPRSDFFSGFFPRRDWTMCCLVCCGFFFSNVTGLYLHFKISIRIHRSLFIFVGLFSWFSLYLYSMCVYISTWHSHTCSMTHSCLDIALLYTDVSRSMCVCM